MRNRDRGSVATGILIAIASLLLVTGIGVAGWQFDWWLQGKNAEKLAQVRDNTPNAQRGYREAARAAIKVVLDPASSVALVKFNTAIACDNIASLDGGFKTSELAQFEFTYCPEG